MRECLAKADFDNARGNRFEKITVVRHKDDRAGEALEKAFEPVDRLGIEVVRGLIQKQEVGLGSQRTAESDTALLSAGERPDQGIKRRSVQRTGKGFDAGLEIPAIRMLDKLKELVQLSIAPLAAFVAAHPLHEVSSAGLDVFENRSCGIEFEFLREVAGAKPTAARDFACVGIVRSGEDFEEACLATAVAPHETDFFTWGNGQRDTVEEDMIAVGEFDFLCGEERWDCGH